MARYVARVKTPRPVDEVFGYMADLRNFAEWDPGVVRSVQVQGEGPGPNAIYDLTVKAFGREMTLRYRVSDFVAPHRLTIEGRPGPFTSIDVITVEAESDRTRVEYDATLEMSFPLSLLDRLIGAAVERISDRAAAGLARSLDGTLVS